ncbi:MAG: EAL domain-containing protein [Bradymonadaceae bacterium]
MPDSEDTYWKELQQIADEFAWGIVDSVRALRVPLGTGERYEDPNEVVSFLRTEFGDAVGEFRGMTVGPEERLEDHYDELVRASSLDNAFQPDGTRLLELLQERRIETWYQPIFADPGLQLHGFECLMRGIDRDGDLIFPDVLLEECYEQNLQFMLDRVCREVHIRNAHARLPEDARVFVNFLPTAIYEPEFCLRTTLDIVDDLGMDRDRIVFEVVETEEIEDRDHLVRLLDFYRNAGFKVALDDVGAGYSGLTMLAELEPDYVKIDKEIVWRVDTSHEHRQICESLADLTDSSNQYLLAEGVETPDQYEFLTSIGTDFYQGYLFRKPDAAPSTSPEWSPP